MGQPLMIICASSFMCFSHALARGGCQHTCNDLVYCVIIVVVADLLQTLSFSYNHFGSRLLTLTVALPAGVLKSAPVLPAAVLCFSHGVDLVIFSPKLLVSL